jgi:hypothetical protein
MADATVDAGTAVHHVGKVDMVGQGVQPQPWHRFTTQPVLVQYPDAGGIGDNELVTGLAFGHGRNPGYHRFVCVMMAVETVNAVVAGMNFMAEGNRLNRSTLLKIKRQNVERRQSAAEQNSATECGTNDHYFAHEVFATVIRFSRMCGTVGMCRLLANLIMMESRIIRAFGALFRFISGRNLETIVAGGGRYGVKRKWRNAQRQAAE